MKELYYFTAGWCQPCQTLGPIIQAIGQNISIRKIDVDYTPDVVSVYQVKNIPTVILVENGQELRRFIGVKSYDEILNWIK